MIRWIYALPVLLLACNPQQPAEQRVSIGEKASCPYLTADAKGNTVLSWVEESKPGDGQLYYAVAGKDADQFGSPIPISSAHGIQAHAENLPKLLFRPNGQVIAMYGTAANDSRNKYAGKVFYTVSQDGGRNWSQAIPLVNDTASYDQRYFDMALLPDGRAAAVWLDNRKNTKAEGSSLYYAVLSGNRFENELSITDKVCQCCRTDLYIDDRGGIHVAFRAILNDTVRDMVHVQSTDGGVTFTAPARISADNWVINGCPHTGPTMVKNVYGLHFAWFTMGSGEGVFYCQSQDNGVTCTKKESISALPTAKHPQMAAVGDASIALVWDESVKAGDKYNNRIGLQWKDANGAKRSTRFITPDSAFASFPVLRPVNDHQLLVAYKKREGEAERVYWQLIKD
ncbi:exo-alpha-sialidase [Chitinophaga horti]|uniref:Exo-alpha-sialidase n=1 Tax=Chitinophaga horti TaxID=2920382 RepID=A0ABY6J5D3_9BACT|nr:exo-alpha-sialidase [Chitinophaga horti]UYQ93509.1 exo-alpha-sialidase [Chitinophaga horti]